MRSKTTLQGPSREAVPLRIERKVGLDVVMALLLGVVMAPLARGQVTTRGSVDSSGAEADRDCGCYARALSHNGRFLAFFSPASNLVPRDRNHEYDVFVRDRTGSTTRLSQSLQGDGGNAHSSGPTISADGSTAAYVSLASNLVPGDQNSTWDIFVCELDSGHTTRASLNSSGQEGNDSSIVVPSLSAHGRYVAMGSLATNLVPGDANDAWDVFVRDREARTTARVSVDSLGGEANGDSRSPSISDDGRFVTFESSADNLVRDDTNGATDVFVHDRVTRITRRVSVSTLGVEGNRESFDPCISGDGRWICYSSSADNLVPTDHNLVLDAFLYDLKEGKTQRVSVSADGAAGIRPSSAGSISYDGRLVAFTSKSNNLVDGDGNGTTDVFLRDCLLRTTRRVSVDSAGVESDGSCTTPALAGDGRFVAFRSAATNLVSDDTNDADDVFVHGAELTLDATPGRVAGGEELSLITQGGRAGAHMTLLLVAVNEVPFLLRLYGGHFDPNGRHLVRATVPPALAGNTVTLQSSGFVPSSKLRLSNRETVAFD